MSLALYLFIQNSQKSRILYPMCYSFTIPDGKVITVRKLHVDVYKSYSYFFNAGNNSLNKNAFHHVLTISLIFLGLLGLFIVVLVYRIHQWRTLWQSLPHSQVPATQPGPCHGSLAAHSALRVVNVWWRVLVCKVAAAALLLGWVAVTSTCSTVRGVCESVVWGG